MSRASPQMRRFAAALMAYEEAGATGLRNHPPSESYLAEKLRPQLSTLAGNGGFHALHSRALALASMEVPWLRGLQIQPDGSLEGMDEFHSRLTADDFREGQLVLSARLLELLVAFIGEKITLNLVREVWSPVRSDDLNPNPGATHE